MGNYSHRLSAVEARLGFKECGDELCFRCVMAKQHVALHGGEWAGCDGRPANLDNPRDFSDSDLEQAIAYLQEEIQRSAT